MTEEDIPGAPTEVCKHRAFLRGSRAAAKRAEGGVRGGAAGAAACRHCKEGVYAGASWGWRLDHSWAWGLQDWEMAAVTEAAWAGTLL